MKSILFICTGNIFRSLTAEYALKTVLGTQSVYVVGSAGIEALPAELHPLVRDRLLLRGADPSQHVQRKLTRELLQSVDVPVCMGFNHREFIRRQFGQDVLLFNQICYEKDEPVLDVNEAIEDWQVKPQACLEYATSLIDYIWDAMPAFLSGLSRLTDGRNPAHQLNLAH
jgi:protein-tyrosine phosphatase